MPNDPTVQQAAAELARLSISAATEDLALVLVTTYALSVPVPIRGQALLGAVLVTGRIAHQALDKLPDRAFVALTEQATEDPAAGLPTMNCRSCGQLMIMVPHWKSGQASPLQPDPGGEIVIESGRWKTVGKAGEGDKRPRYTTHFAKCPQAKKYRRAR